MIVTERFAFIHLHKSGGSFVSTFLLSFFPSARRIGYHYPFSVLPEAYRGLPLLGSVRNPWDVYVSYYFFQRELLEMARARNAAMTPQELDTWIAAGNDPLNGVDILFDELSDRATLGFVATTRRILQLGVDDSMLDRLLAEMPRTLDMRGRSTPKQIVGFRGMNVRAQDLATIRGTGEGLYSFLFRHLYGGGRDVHFLRMERLREELLAYLDVAGVDVTPEMEDFVRGSARIKTSRHASSASYYDRELAALVEERDGGLAQRFKYGFDLEAQTP